MTATIRPATAADIPAIQQIGLGTWPATYSFAGQDYIDRGLATWWSEEAVARSLTSTITLVAERNRQVIGMGNLDTRQETPTIWKLYVLPAAQGTGAGHALITALIEAAPVGAPGVCLEYSDGNTKARAFYDAHGFTETHRTPNENPAWPDQVWMTRATTQA